MKKDKSASLLLTFILLVGSASAIKKTETATKPPVPPPPPPEIIFIKFSPDVTPQPQNDDINNARLEDYLRRRVYEFEPYLGTAQNQQYQSNNVNQLTLSNTDFNVMASRPVYQRPQHQTQGQRPHYQTPHGQKPHYQIPQSQIPQHQTPQGQRPQHQTPQGQGHHPQGQGSQHQGQRPQAHHQRPTYNPPRLPFASVISSPLSRPHADVTVLSR